MPVVQSSYTRYPRAGVAGAPASTTGFDADTKFCETAAGISFGYAVSRGSDPKGAVLGGTDFIGATYRDVTLKASNSDKYAQKDLMGVMVRGDIWVVVEDDVAAGDDVEFNATTGQFGSDGGTRVPSARWMTSALAGGLAILRLGDAAAPHDVDTIA